MSELNMKVQFKKGTAIANKKKVEQDLQQICGKDGVSVDPIDKLAYGKDYILISNRWTLEGIQPSEPDFITWPKTADQIASIIKYANQNKVPIIPYGEGSGVVGAAIATNGGIIIDMKNFRHRN